jgi:hypothetical protein
MNYKKVYDAIIERAKNRNLYNTYSEKHHIVPKCLGGKDNKENIVRLTGREHFICHQLLHKMHPDNYGLLCAILFMSKYKRLNSRCYSWIREKFSKETAKRKTGMKYSEETNKKKARTGSENGMFGKTHSNEVKEKQSKMMKNMVPVRHIETGERRLISKDDELYKNGTYVSLTLGRKHQGEYKGTKEVMECPHCKKVGKGGAMKRYHFDNCKQKSL